MGRRLVKGNTEKDDDKKIREKYSKAAGRHVLVIEADMSEDDKRHVFNDADRLRMLSNHVLGIMLNNLTQLLRTKKYRALKKLYGEYKEKVKKYEDKKKGKKEKNEKLDYYREKMKNISSQMNEMREKYNVTLAYCRSIMTQSRRDYNVNCVFAKTRAADIWGAIEKILFSDGEKVHFHKKGDFPCISAVDTKAGITLSVIDGKLWFNYNNGKYGKVKFTYKDSDNRFINDEINAILKYLEQPEVNDKYVINEMLKGNIVSTYRPCYVSLVCKTIRGKLRVYIHITLEGKAMPKYDKNGNLKHKHGTGVIGSDVGTQTVATNSDNDASLKNLGERGSSIEHNEKVERKIKRQMDRSLRQANPQNYNEDGTVKKGKKTWHFSKRYLKLKRKLAEISRKNAENRHYAINEEVNKLREKGHILVTEQKNSKKLQKRVKETTVNENGKYNRKKRFGKSIQNRCPGYFQSKAKQVFENTGGRYIEVPSEYRASQYDHTADDYIKKKLSQRMFKLNDGTVVQRDWYSSFLLYCINLDTLEIDKDKCKERFPIAYQNHLAMIDEIKRNHIKVLNSGIKVS